MAGGAGIGVAGLGTGGGGALAFPGDVNGAEGGVTGTGLAEGVGAPLPIKAAISFCETPWSCR